MGLSYGSQSGQTASNTSQSTSGTYAPAQSAVQGQLGGTLSSDLSAASGGTLSPGVTAGETAADNEINQTSSGLTNRVTQMLAARGFGPSGTTGQATLQGELNRESQVGSEAGIAQGQQQSLNSNNLLAALNYAFTSLGSTGTGATSGTSSGSNFGAQVAGGISF